MGLFVLCAPSVADGSPRVIRVGYLVRETTIVTWTIPTSVKVRSLQADPRVEITIDAGGVPPCALPVRGSAATTPVSWARLLDVTNTAPERVEWLVREKGLAS